MFNDDYSEENEEYMNKEDVMKMHQQQVEDAFFDAKKEGKDISIFLYMPVDFLSEKVRIELDHYLLDVAYDKFFVENREAFYEDDYLKISPVEDTATIKTLEEMLQHYINVEDYEKCVQIRDKINSIKEEKNGKADKGTNQG